MDTQSASHQPTESRQDGRTNTYMRVQVVCDVLERRVGELAATFFCQEHTLPSALESFLQEY